MAYGLLAGGDVMHRINDDKGYFVVEVLGVANLTGVIDAIRDAFSQPKYFEKNNIFIFPREYFEVQLEQLELITQYILENFQLKSFTTKSAIVVPRGFNMAIVNLWATSAHRLPYELKVFSALEEAEQWVAAPVI